MSQTDEKQLNKNLLPRPPIVVVMGHIDHGKTTLLDYIRKSSVAAKESGGITQHIGAYEIELKTKNQELKTITFIDTPGHEAFSKMRSRGAKVADIAVLVVAADDGVKPQTKEALSAISDAKIPFCVAINKIDKSSADPERVKNELAAEQIFLEGRGGNVPFVEISAKHGTAVDELLEAILLMAELEDLRTDFGNFAEGVVIESHRDPKRGVASAILILSGILKKGDYVAAGKSIAKVKILENFAGKNIDNAGPSAPVRVIGFDTLPQVGAEFKTFKTYSDAELFTKALAGGVEKYFPQPNPLIMEADESGTLSSNRETIVLGIIIKTDVSGSAEAVLHEIEKLKNERVEMKILRTGAGDISEDDIKFAASSENPLIFGFKVSISQAAKELAERFKVEFVVFQIIYEILDFLKKKIETLAPSEAQMKIAGKAKILKIFPAKVGKNQVVGGKVSDGTVRRGARFNLLRRDRKMAEGKIENLQSGRINVAEVAAGSEFGALASSKFTIATGDIIECLE